MNYLEILKLTDHTELKQTAGLKDILKAVDEGIKWNTASVCIPPAFVSEAAEYAAGRVRLAVVTGFPNGYDSTAAKLKETETALNAGAAETDTVLNVGRFVSGDYAYCLEELKALKSLSGDKILKVIVETCFLDEAQKRDACKLVMDAGADFIKTSTGFGKGGANVADVELFRECTRGAIGIKASGGIRSFEFAEQLIAAGATRIGASALVSLAEKL